MYMEAAKCSVIALPVVIDSNVIKRSNKTIQVMCGRHTSVDSTLRDWNKKSTPTFYINIPGYICCMCEQYNYLIATAVSITIG